jgi:AcrR family transcriptional regulator
MVVSVQTDPKQARSKKTKEKIIQAAIQLFQERGYEGTTSNEIASAAGVSVGSFYAYFADKRQLLLTVFDRLADELFKNVFEGLTPSHLFDEDLRPVVRQAVARSIEEKQKLAGLHRVISEMVLKDEDFAARRKAMLDRAISKLNELFTLGTKAGLMWELDIEAAAFVVNRVVFDLSQDYVIGNCDFDRDRAIDALSDMILRYLFKPKN